MSNINRYLWILMVFFLLSGLSGCDKSEYYRECAGSIWNTQYHISYDYRNKLDDSIQNVFKEIDNSLSMYNDNSITGRINRNDTSVRVDSLFKAVFEESKRINELSEGCFDPTIAPLINLWGFGKNKGNVDSISSDEIESVRRYVGIVDCRIDSEGRFIKKEPRTELDFSAIAKGYACDRIAELFDRAGIKNYLIEIGGEIVGKGVNHEGIPWKIMIESPLAEPGIVGDTPLGIIGISDMAVATSGSYRKQRQIGEKRFSHILDPRTGRPEFSDILSVTVIARSCMTADALATSCMLMKPERALRMLEELPETDGLIVVSEGNNKLRFLTTSGFPPFIH